MRGDSTGRALKSLIAELSNLEDDDIEAIVSDLDSDGRGTIQNLLRSYRAGSIDLSERPEKIGKIDGWLGHRLTEGGSTGLTHRARETLARVHDEVSLTTHRAAPAALPAGRGVMGFLRGNR